VQGEGGGGVILALDCATKTGWALIKSGMVYESGVQDFSKKRGESNGIMFIRFRKWISNMFKENKPSLIVYEQTPLHFKSGSALEISMNLTGRVQEEADKEFIQYTSYAPTALKKFATGAGKADKGAMIKACEQKSGMVTTDDNEADAILLGLMAYEEYGVN
jgi:Holliday junction resolvasome RuvABC endonuclease subunit